MYEPGKTHKRDVRQNAQDASQTDRRGADHRLGLIYALVATTVAAATLGAAHWSVHLLYFLVTGLLWILPAMVIIK